MMINNFINLPDWGFIYVFGSEASTFLQGQFTIDILQVTDTKAKLSAYCNPKGRIISIFILFKYKQGYGLFLPTNNIPLLLKSLTKYARFSKVTCQDLTASFNKIGYLSQTPQENYSPNYNVKQDILTLHLPGHRVLLASQTHSCASLKTLFTIKNSQSPHALTPVHWTRLDIQEKIPFLDACLQEKLLIHPLNLVDLKAVSFSKGCYMGQEIIARSQYKGTIKKHACVLQINSKTTIKITDKLFCDSQEVGLIINSIDTQPDFYLVLMIIKDKIFNTLKSNSLEFIINNEVANVILDPASNAE